MDLGAPELALRPVQLEAALQLPQLSRLQLGREPCRTNLGTDLEVLGHRAVGLLAAV